MERKRGKKAELKYRNRAVMLYKSIGYHSHHSLCKQCLWSCANAVALGVFIQDQNTVTNIKSGFLVFICLEGHTIKDDVAKSDHICHELIIGRVVACMLVIWHSWLSWIHTYPHDGMRQALPTSHPHWPYLKFLECPYWLIFQIICKSFLEGEELYQFSSQILTPQTINLSYSL